MYWSSRKDNLNIGLCLGSSTWILTLYTRWTKVPTDLFKPRMKMFDVIYFIFLAGFCCRLQQPTSVVCKILENCILDFNSWRIDISNQRKKRQKKVNRVLDVPQDTCCLIASWSLPGYLPAALERAEQNHFSYKQWRPKLFLPTWKMQSVSKKSPGEGSLLWNSLALVPTQPACCWGFAG